MHLKIFSEELKYLNIFCHFPSKLITSMFVNNEISTLYYLINEMMFLLKRAISWHNNNTNFIEMLFLKVNHKLIFLFKKYC